MRGGKNAKKKVVLPSAKENNGETFFSLLILPIIHYKTK